MNAFRVRRWLGVALLIVACLLAGSQVAAADDPPPARPTVGFDGGGPTVTAPGTNGFTVPLTVKLNSTDPQATGTANVTYTVADTTQSGNQGGSLTFNLDGSNSPQTIPITVSGLAGGTITVTLTGADNADISNATATVTVNAAPSASVANATFAGQPANTSVTLPVTLSAPAAGDVSVGIAAQNGTAKSAVDYTVDQSTVTIPAGAQSADLPIKILGATRGGTFTVTLTGVTTGNATLGNATATITITAAPIPQVAVQDATVARGATDTLVQIPVTIQPAAGSQINVNYSQQDISATYGSDYELVNTTLAIPAGTTATSIPVNIRPGIASQPVQFKLILTAITKNAQIQRSTATVTISPSAASLPKISIASTTLGSGTADRQAAIPVSLSQATSADVTVKYAASNGTALSGTDFVLQNGTLTIPKGQQSASIPVTIKGGTKGGTFTVTLTNPSSNATLGTASATMTISSAAPVVSIADATLAVGATDTTGTVTATLSASASTAVTVAYSVADGTAKSGVDYVANPGTLTFAPGQTTATVPVTVKAGSAGGTFTLTLANPVGATVDPLAGKATVTLVNGPALSIADLKVGENVAGGKAVLTVTLVGTPTGPVTVTYKTSDGTALASSDYVATQGTLTIPVGQTTASISVTITNDTLTEANETFQVTLSNPQNAAIARGTATVTILDDESGQASSGNGGVGFGNPVLNTPGTRPRSGSGAGGSGGGSTGGGGGGGATGGSAGGTGANGGSSGGKTGSSSAAAKIGVAALARTIGANRLLRLRVTCPKTATARCVGSITVATVQTKTTKSKKLGSAAIGVKPGVVSILSVRLVPSVTSLLAHGKTLKTMLTVSIGTGSSKSVATHALVLQGPKQSQSSVTITVP